MRLGVGPFTVGQTALKVASSKVAKHEKACSDNQHAFYSRSMNVVFTRIGFAIQKGLAVQFVARLPSIQV